MYDFPCVFTQNVQITCVFMQNEQMYVRSIGKYTTFYYSTCFHTKYTIFGVFSSKMRNFPCVLTQNTQHVMYCRAKINNFCSFSCKMHNFLCVFTENALFSQYFHAKCSNFLVFRAKSMNFFAQMRFCNKHHIIYSVFE